MNHQGNNLIGFLSGIFGGIGSFLLDIRIGVLSDLVVAIITAALCGAAGVAGKEGYLFIKKSLKKKNGIKEQA